MAVVRRIMRIPFHPFFVGMYPATFFLYQNISEIEIIDSARVFIAVPLAVGILFLLLQAFVRDWDRSALLSSLITFLFFSYGHVYTFLKSVNLFGVSLGRHRFLIIIFAFLFVLGAIWTIRKRRLSDYTMGLNLLSIFLFIVPLLQIGYYAAFPHASGPSQLVLDGITPPKDQTTYPDVYYIIPDAYTRDDDLLEVYSFDNTPFLEALEDRGFYVARCSRSNYAWTRLSLGSTLNLDYIQEVHPSLEFSGIDDLIRDNVVLEVFRSMGYKVIAFDTAFPPTLWYNADYLFSYRSEHSRDPFSGLREYEALFFRTTAGLVLLDVDTLLQGKTQRLVYESPKHDRYIRVAYNLEKLDTVPSIAGPKFVFAHINIPHEPYIFDKTGEFVPDQRDDIVGYRQQVEYVNSRILRLVDTILAQSSTPPIILIQGDHGSIETENDIRRVHILSAYYLPEGGAKALYPSITPVNTFRLILDMYFGQTIGLLPDVSYYSDRTALFDFEVVPVTRQGCVP